MMQHLPQYIWTLIFTFYIIIFAFTFIVPSFEIYLFLENLKKNRLSRLRKEYENLLQKMEENIFVENSDEKLRQVTQKVEAFKILIEEENKISSLPLTKGVIFTIIESIFYYFQNFL